MSENTAQQLASEIAEELGSEWTVTPHGLANRGGETYDGLAHVTRKDGKASLYIRVGGWRNEGRARISGNYVDHTASEVYFRDGEPGALKDELTASMSRSGAAIAKDIIRKILPAVIANQAAIMDRLEATAHDSHREYTLTKRFQAIMPSMEALGPSGNHFADRLTTGYFAPVNVDIRITHKGMTEMKIKDLTADETAAVLQLLAELRDSSAVL